jgi:hypothetical protein
MGMIPLGQNRWKIVNNPFTPAARSASDIEAKKKSCGPSSHEAAATLFPRMRADDRRSVLLPRFLNQRIETIVPRFYCHNFSIID